MKRKIGKNATPYESAFEEFLRKQQVLYIATDETKRPIFKGTTIKNFDFIVVSFKGKYMVDVKGRRFANKSWANWIHFADIEGMKNWSMLLSDLSPLFVYIYLLDQTSSEKFQDKLVYKGKEYGFVGITFEDFYQNMKRVGKEKKKGIGGVGISGKKFREIIKPITYFIPELKKVPTGNI